MSEFTTVTRRGWGSRSKNSLGGALFGFVLLAVGTVLLFWNEGRAVKRYKDLKEGAGIVVSTDSGTIDPAMEGKLVHTTGEAVTSAPLTDSQFGITEKAIKLIREVEMYQWKENVTTETSTRTGGTEETKKTYSYSKVWNGSLIDSSRFQVKDDHSNPPEMKYKAASFLADGVTLGAFKLPEFLVEKIGGATRLPIESLESAPEGIKGTARLHNQQFYFGSDPLNPRIGDMRVSFSIIRPGPVSIVAQQANDSFVPYQAKTGGTVSLLERGILPSGEIFAKAHERNKMLTWVIRVGGFVMLGIAFSMILGPLSVFASVLPFLGRIVETGTTIIAFLLAGILWTIVVAFAWIFYRPFLGIALLVITVGLISLIVRRLRAAKGSGPVSPPPPLDTPPPLT
ncbi:MAG: TMEM43 family protein [Verrucomicrobiales bacterium]|nr:TMEM43 family protein [Verrucomicrobiales bacterium]